MQKPKELLCLGHHLYEKSDMDTFLAELEKKHEEEKIIRRNLYV